MTSFEKKQPNSVFYSAGVKAFLMLIPVQNNPYYLKPYRDLWDKGHRQAKRKYDADRYRQQKEAQAEAEAAGFATKPKPRYTNKRVEGSTISSGRIQQFNAKFRTAS